MSMTYLDGEKKQKRLQNVVKNQNSKVMSRYKMQLTVDA